MIPAGRQRRQLQLQGHANVAPWPDILVAVALWATKPRLPARSALHPPSQRSPRHHCRGLHPRHGLGRHRRLVLSIVPGFKFIQKA